MLRIGKLTDYALLILGQMAKAPDALLSATSLADALHLAAPTVSKILKILSEAGLVSSVRGADGGYRLTRTPDKITVNQVLVAMEGELALTTCCRKTQACFIDSLCSMRENWQKINKMIQFLLDQLTIIDMLAPNSTFNDVIGHAILGLNNGK